MNDRQVWKNLIPSSFELKKSGKIKEKLWLEVMHKDASVMRGYKALLDKDEEMRKKVKNRFFWPFFLIFFPVLEKRRIEERAERKGEIRETEE